MSAPSWNWSWMTRSGVSRQRSRRARLAEDHLVGADDAVVRVLADQRIDLEPAGVAHHRAVPVHEPMDAAAGLDRAHAGPAHQVEGVDDDAGTPIAA